jgi:hypothetical protein
LGLAPRAAVTTLVLQKVVWAGANCRSYPLAADGLAELAGVRLSAKQVRRMTAQVGAARVAEREAEAAEQQARTFPERRAGRAAAAPPELAVISLDGGRYQRRDEFGVPRAERKHKTHWRETKVGCLLSMRSRVSAKDPAPEPPAWLLHSPAIAELAKLAENPAADADAPAETAAVEFAAAAEEGYEPPELLARDVLASSAGIEEFGWQLAARAWRLGFPRAARQAFVADGAAANWNVQRTHFPDAVPIADLMHAAAYAYSAGQACGGRETYERWAAWLWRGEIPRLLEDLAAQQERLGPPPPDAGETDPRRRVERAWTYFTNNHRRMNYPEYRRQGLPLTSSHMESTVKLINRRVKGTEQFWGRDSGEAVLQLRADYLSASNPLANFWLRWQSQQTGSNRYHTAA